MTLINCMTLTGPAPVGFRDSIIRVFCTMVLLAAAFQSLASERPVTTVYIAGSGNPALDQHITGLLAGQLGESVSLIPIDDDQLPTIIDNPVVTIGAAATTRVHNTNPAISVLALFAETAFINDLAEKFPGQISGIPYDVPLLRQALTGKAILPQATRIALLATEATAGNYDQLLKELPAYGMEARVFLVESSNDLIPTLVRALGYGDFLLAAPDTEIYNSRTIKHILLTAYRRNMIVIGPTQAYVKAGSLASSYTPFPAMAELAARFLKSYFTDGRFPAPAYPDHYGVVTNNQVARSLNIPLPDRDDIGKMVQKVLSAHKGEG